MPIKQLKYTIMILLCLTAGILGCISQHQTRLKQNIYWYENQGVIYTNDLPRLQNQISFSIYLPKYLPDEVDTLQLPELILQPESGSTNDIKIQIFYKQMKSGFLGMIMIEEINSPKKWLPNEDMEYTYLNFSGMSVLEEKSTTTLLESGEIVIALHYAWNNMEINFSMDTTAFEQIEARKIVESMIN